MKMKTTILNFLYTLSVVLCLGYNLHAEERLVRIGVSAPLTGDLAEYGAAVRNGIELARAENEQDFSAVKFIYEDNRYEAAKAVSAYNKLRNIDKVDAIFNWGEPTLHAVAPIAERAHFPLLAMSLDPTPAEGKNYVQLTINPAEEYARTLVEYLRKQGIKRLGVIQTEDPFLDSMVAGIRMHLKDGESLKVFATVRPGDSDFKTQVARLKQTDFDAIGIYLFSGQVSAFFRQAAAQRLTGPFWGTDFFESRSEIKSAGPAIDGAVYPNLKIPQGFVKRYRAKHGNDAQIAYAYNAYEFAITTARLFPKKKNTFSAKNIIASYKGAAKGGAIFKEGKTAGGAVYYQFPIGIKMVKGSEFVDVG